MEPFDQIAKYKPAAPPVFQHSTREGRLKRPLVACWINTQGVPVPLTTRGFHLRKTALWSIRDSMRDASSPEMNCPTRYYVWDSSWPTWAPDNPNCWTPVAASPRDQWIPSR